MKIKWFFTLLFMMGFIILLVSCVPVPTCQPWAMVAPQKVSPAMWEVVNTLTPILTWTYPTLGYPPGYPPPHYAPTNCLPERFNVMLYEYYDLYADNMGGETSGPDFVYIVSSPLQAATEYWWIVHGMVGTSIGPNSSLSNFFTGPLCSEVSMVLVPPILLEPANDAVLNNTGPIFDWDYPDPCLPDGYRIDLSVTADFSDTSLSNETGIPTTVWNAGEPLMDCTDYYWKVTPMIGTTLGPSSDTFQFTIDVFGSCFTPPTLEPPELYFPPFATPPPVRCQNFLDPISCKQNPACKWIVATVRQAAVCVRR